VFACGQAATLLCSVGKNRGIYDGNSPGKKLFTNNLKIKKKFKAKKTFALFRNIFI